LQAGQEVLTVPSLQTKLEAQIRGWGVGFLPRPMAQAHLDAGSLVLGLCEGLTRHEHIGYAWRRAPSGGEGPGRALKWWLNKLKSPVTRRALLGSR
jgi:DNA-binding transcriptional LysR family regulator